MMHMTAAKTEHSSTAPGARASRSSCRQQEDHDDVYYEGSIWNNSAVHVLAWHASDAGTPGDDASGIYLSLHCSILGSVFGFPYFRKPLFTYSPYIPK